MHIWIYLYIYNLRYVAFIGHAGTVELGGAGEVLNVQVVFIESVVSFYVQRIGEEFSVSNLMADSFLSHTLFELYFPSLLPCPLSFLPLSFPPPPHSSLSSCRKSFSQWRNKWVPISQRMQFPLWLPSRRSNSTAFVGTRRTPEVMRYGAEFSFEASKRHRTRLMSCAQTLVIVFLCRRQSWRIYLGSFISFHSRLGICGHVHIIY